MAPLLVSALVGVGVKIVTDLFMSGAKQVMKSSGAGASFAATLDNARSATPAASPDVPGQKPSALDVGFADRSRVMTADLGNAMPATGRAQAAASYRRLEDIPPQAV